MLHCFNHLHGPLLDSLEYVHVWQLSSGYNIADVSQPVLSRKKGHIPDPAGSALPDQAQDTIVLSVASTC